MAVTSTPDIVFDNEQPRKLNRKERRANLAKARTAMREFKKSRGASVAPPEAGLIGNVVDPGHETEMTEDAKNGL